MGCAAIIRRLVRSAGVTLAVLAPLGGASTAAAQAPGTLDPSFGSGGVVSSSAQLLGVAVQANGEVVAAGQAGGSVYVERLNAAGQLDGQYTGASGYARAVAVQPDGKIVIAGSSGGAMFVERLSSSLTPDPSFGAQGLVGAFGGTGAAANAVALEPDASIVAAGSAGGEVAAARFTASGGLEWGTGLNSGNNSAAEGIAIQPADGKIVLVGRQTPLGETNGIIARLTAVGSLDPGFANGLYAYRYPGGGYTTFDAVALQNDGKLVVAGVAIDSTNNALFARFTPSGVFDASFGSAGTTVVPAAQSIGAPGDAVGAYGAGIAGGGRIFGAGSSEYTGVSVFPTEWALSSTGSLDPTFASGGTATGPGNADEACAAAVAPDGSLVAVGGTVTAFPDSNPCTVNSQAHGFVMRRIGYGPPPPPATGGTAPAVTTGGVGSLTAITAQISGQVNPKGAPTTYRFDYGPTTAYGSTTPTTGAGSGSSSLSATAVLTALHPSSTYHYRLEATNATGTSYGADTSFTTLAASRPAVTTGPATAVSEVSARLTGNVAANGLSTTYYFQYGTGRGYGRTTGKVTVAADSAAGVSSLANGLRPATTWHYRLVAQNPDGTSYGRDRTLKTSPRLKVSIGAVPRRYATASLQARKLKLSVGCNQACTVRATLLIPRATLRRRHISNRQDVVALGLARLRRSGKGTVRLHATASGSLLARLRGASLTLRLSLAPSGGGPAVTRTHALVLT